MTLPIAAASHAIGYGMQIAALSKFMKRQAAAGLRRSATGMRPGMHVTGLADVKRQIQHQMDRKHRALVAALHETGWAIADRSQEIVPVE